MPEARSRGYYRSGKSHTQLGFRKPLCRVNHTPLFGSRIAPGLQKLAESAGGAIGGHRQRREFSLRLEQRQIMRRVRLQDLQQQATGKLPVFGATDDDEQKEVVDEESAE